DAKEISKGLFDLLRLIDFALLQACAELLYSDIYVDDLVGPFEKAVRNGLAHGDASRPQYCIVESLEVLDIDGSHYMNTCIEQIQDILIPLSVFGTGNISVGQFIDYTDVRFASNDGFDVHLLKNNAAVFDLAARNHFEISDLGFGVGPAIGLDETDYQVKALAAQQVSVLKHLVGLADARGGADVNAEANTL